LFIDDFYPKIVQTECNEAWFKLPRGSRAEPKRGQTERKEAGGKGPRGGLSYAKIRLLMNNEQWIIKNIYKPIHHQRPYHNDLVQRKP